MKRRNSVGLVVVFFIFLVFGCKNSPTGNIFLPDEELDKLAILNYISNDLDFKGYFAFDEYYGEEDTLPLEIPLRTINNPRTWYREPQDINRDVSINIVNDSAFISFWCGVNGVFHLLEIDTSASPDTLIDYQKDLVDWSSNYAIFKRYPGVSANRGWILESLTGGVVVGADILPSDCVWVYIDSVRIDCESYEDTLFTTPWVFFGKEELLTFGTEEVVTFTLYSHGTDAYVYPYLHAHTLGIWGRWRFAEKIEPEVWKGYWVTPLTPGIRVIAFDVLMKSSIDEEEFEYHSNIWLFPYRIE